MRCISAQCPLHFGCKSEKAAFCGTCRSCGRGKSKMRMKQWLLKLQHEVAYIICTLTYLTVTYSVAEINNLVKPDIVKAPGRNRPTNKLSSTEKYQIF